jgi:outer membrane biosynthesis protein TonB
MSSGMKAAPLQADSAADPIGWRVANALAIAAPYILAAALFVVLYLQPASPPAQAALSTPSPASESPAADLPTPAAAAPVPAPSTTHPAAPATLKNAAATASGPATPPDTAPAASAAATAPPAAKDPPLPTQPVPVDTAIARTMKLSGDPPQPSAAVRSAHLHGVVVVSAIVGPDGAVQSVQPVSGPALLELETLTAVRSWRYHPYLIYGKPVSFQTQVVIDFELDSSLQ